MKIYTKIGDEGQTSMFGGAMIPKDHARIEAYGTVDELMVSVGKLASELSEGEPKSFLVQVLNHLFDIGSYLAGAYTDEQMQGQEIEYMIGIIEKGIDDMQGELPELTSFVLPIGEVSAVYAHECRVMTRRAERRIVSSHHERPVAAKVLVFINRLSDYFFVLARWLNYRSGIEDELWKKIR